MKLLKVSLLNINSLVGGWTVDFQAPDFQAPAFVIAGPTGAGKSSILDAITLALYGRTGRQSRVSQSENEVMSRGTGQCAAAVEFLGADGSPYRAEWRQRRARNRPGGALQRVERRFVRLANGEEDATPHLLAEAERAIAEAVGLSFDQFVRAVVLEQGRFAAFLTAKPADRASILEKATRTEGFSETGSRIFEAFQEAKRACNAATAAWEERRQRAAGFSPEAQAAAGDRLANARRNTEELGRELAALQAEKTWVAAEADLARREREAGGRRERLAARERAFEPSREPLARAVAARGLDVRRTALEGLREAARQAEGRLEAAKGELARRSGARQGLETRLREAKQAAENASRLCAEGRATVARARALDTELAAMAEAEAAAERAAQDAARRREEAQRAQARLVADLEGGRKRLAAAEAFDAGTPAPPAYAQDPLFAALAREAETERDSKAAREKVAKAQEAADEAAAREAEAEANDERARPEMEAGLRQARTRLEAVRDCIGLAECRARLREGEACPLCGSKEHPMAAGADFSPIFDEAEKAVQKAEKRLEAQRGALDNARMAAGKAARALADAQGLLQRRTDAAGRSRQEARGGVAALRAELAEKERRRQQGALDLAALQEDETQKAAAAREKAQGRDERLARRQALLATSADEEAARLDSLEKKTADKAAEAWTALERAEARIAECASQIQRGEADLAQARRRRDDARAGFLAAAAAAGFADEPAWARARMEDAPFADARREEEAIMRERTGLQDAEADLRRDRAVHDGNRPAVLHENLDGLLTEKSGAKAAADETVGATQAALAQMRRDEEALGAVQRRYEAAKARAGKMENLNRWFGGEGGTAFRTYVQGITLSRLLGAANEPLATMSAGRYELSWDPDDEKLLPAVVDRWQLNARRAVSNLSGGETFMVSLALALALGRLAGDDLSVESLFLDEGFGTLDSEKLALALQTLTERHADGCRVGIITHVEAVKGLGLDRIDVLPVTDGRSRLSGPGVSSWAAPGLP